MAASQAARWTVELLDRSTVAVQHSRCKIAPLLCSCLQYPSSHTQIAGSESCADGGHDFGPGCTRERKIVLPSIRDQRTQYVSATACSACQVVG